MARTEPDDLEDVVAQLRERRALVAARLQRIDAALEALGVPVGGATSTPTRGAVERRVGASVNARVLDLLDAEDRDWSVAEVIEAFERRGDPLVGSSVSNNVRSVLAKASQTGRVLRTSPGRYKSSRHDRPVAEPTNNNGSAVAEPSSFA